MLQLPDSIRALQLPHSVPWISSAGAGLLLPHTPLDLICQAGDLQLPHSPHGSHLPGNGLQLPHSPLDLICRRRADELSPGSLPWISSARLPGCNSPLCPLDLICQAPGCNSPTLPWISSARRRAGELLSPLSLCVTSCPCRSIEMEGTVTAPLPG